MSLTMSGKCSMSANANMREVIKLVSSIGCVIRVNLVPNMFRESLGLGLNVVKVSEFVADAA